MIVFWIVTILGTFGFFRSCSINNRMYDENLAQLAEERKKVKNT